MRLFLLPVSTRRTLIYCERVQPILPAGQKPPVTERIISKAAETWSTWERAEKGWQKRLTVEGNKLLKRIPYEEWGLKSIPPGTKKRLEDVDKGETTFECLYPGSFMEGGRVGGVLRQLATERQAMHKSNMWKSLLLTPATLPFIVIPIIPNIPFFYLVFRAYSHFRALYGGKLLEHLVEKDLVKISPSAQMDKMYTAGLLHPTREESRKAPSPTEEETERVSRVVEAQTEQGKEDVMVLQKWNGKLIAEAFHLPEMEIEIERAVEQVESSIAKDRTELGDEKEEVMRARAQKSASVEHKEVKR